MQNFNKQKGGRSRSSKEMIEEELQKLSNLKSPTEVFPLARLKFFFHTLDETTCYPAEALLNGKIALDQNLAQPDKRALTFTKFLLSLCPPLLLFPFTPLFSCNLSSSPFSLS